MTSSDNIDQIEAKLDSLGLRLPNKVEVPSDVRTPPAWVLKRGDKVYISGHGAHGIVEIVRNAREANG